MLKKNSIQFENSGAEISGGSFFGKGQGGQGGQGGHGGGQGGQDSCQKAPDTRWTGPDVRGTVKTRGFVDPSVQWWGADLKGRKSKRRGQIFI